MCSLTLQACQTIPSLEPATSGLQWFLHATPLLTTFQMRSPHHTARKTAARKGNTWNIIGCLHSSSGLFFIILQKSVEEKEARKGRRATEHTNFDFSPRRGRKHSSPRAPLTLFWPALCVFVHMHIERDNLVKARTVYTSICLMQRKQTSSVRCIL